MAFVFREWWAANKGSFNEKRKARYQKDPEHRAHVTAVNAASRRRRKEAQLQQEAEADRYRKVAIDGKYEWKQMEVQNAEGETVWGFSIGALAAATRRSIQSLRAWETAGIIPPADLRSPKGDRLYTAERIEQIEQKLRAEGRLRETNRQRRGLPHVEKLVRFPDNTVRPVVLFLVAAVAEAIKRTIVTVQQMEAREVLPPTPFRASGRRYRLYTVEQIAAVKTAYESVNSSVRDPASKAAFRKAVEEAWEKLGINGACVVEDTDAAEGAGAGSAASEEATS